MEKLFLDHPWIIILILLWTLPWKGAALWRAARRGHVGWFLTLIILNTFAILDILYIFIFSNWGAGKNQQQENPQQDRRRLQPQPRQPQFSRDARSRTTVI